MVLQRRVDGCSPWLAVVTLSFFCSGAPVRADEAAQRFQSHVDYLASDDLEGRGVGSQGIEKAAAYIADQFQELGLDSLDGKGSYYQTFPMTLHRTLTDEGRLAFDGDAVDRRQGKDFIPFNFSSDEAFRGPVAFCGYGIVAPKRNHDDFADVDVMGEVVLVLRGEPESWSDETGSPTRHAMFRNKVYNAKDRGAVAVLIVNKTPAEGEQDELAEFESHGADAYGIPAFHITREMAEAQLKRGGLDSLDTLQQRIDNGSYASKGLAHIRASGQAGFKRQSADTHNVVSILRGNGPLAEQFVVIGAHYDHLGVRKPMMRKFKEGRLVREEQAAQIHNGADDNASGVSGVIEIARMFSQGPRPKRSILFVAFTGEESGLHGSKHFVENCPVPMSKIVAMLNMDMIGRLAADSTDVTVFGAMTGKEFMDILTDAGKSVGLTVAPSSDPGGRSDHAPFVRQSIPSMHFFSGHHSDYHKPSDDADKINAEGGAKIASMVYLTARKLSDRKAPPTYQAVKSKNGDPSPGGTPSYRVVMGLAPGYTDDGEAGMAVDAVNPDGPADVAGMKKGDHIIKIGGKKVGNIYDYMAATRNNSPGDTVEVVVVRDGKEIKLAVTLSAAR